MDTDTFFSKLKTQNIPANCLRKGDIVRMGNSVVVLEDVIHQKDGDKESITLRGEGCSWHITPYLPGSDSKWSEYTIIVRDSLTEPKPVRRSRRR